MRKLLMIFIDYYYYYYNYYQLSVGCGGSIDSFDKTYNNFSHATLFYDMKGLLIVNKTIISMDINKSGMIYLID